GSCPMAVTHLRPPPSRVTQPTLTTVPRRTTPEKKALHVCLLQRNLNKNIKPLWKFVNAIENVDDGGGNKL
ncbi:hypothetical protein A2U01_0021652, partial [Trifolium medium]|nr:hypothetical protein [Trifolium medium]